MVCRATTFVKIVCANASWFRSLNIGKTRCQAGSLALMTELNHANSGRSALELERRLEAACRHQLARSGHVGLQCANSSPSARP